MSSTTPSPLNFAAERRRAPRSSFAGEIMIQWDGPAFGGRIRDLSSRGLSFCVQHPPEAESRLYLGRQVRLAFRAPACDSASVSIVGDVVRLEADGSGKLLVAVAFQQL